ncbi:MAG: hypothetical protein HQ568_08820, partial [Calditrichaeota bacterium]|nr:hypothetical protein [Calditrichota bacterium]
MKNKTLITISMLVLLLFSWFSVSSAQRSSAVLDKLNKIESRIDRLESARKNDIVKLERKLANISPAEDPSVLTGSIEGLQQKVENLKIELNELRNIQASSSSGPETEIMEDLLTDLRGLTWELRSTLTTAEEPSFEVAVEPETELTLPGVDISGFCNLLYDDDTNGTGFGQLEIDLEAEVAENIVIASAICYDAESEAFGSGALVIDFHLFGSEGSHFRPAQNVDHSGIIVGQFDVPFGIDLNYYPSIDRKLVSGPLVVGNTHDG